MRRLSVVLVAALLTVGMAGTVGAAGAAARTGQRFDTRQYLKTHGYLPLRGPEVLAQAKAYSAKWVKAHPYHGPDAFAHAKQMATPTFGARWVGVTDGASSPKDPNGAIGPGSYVEIINSKMGIYTRTGATVATGNLTAFGSGSLSDPTILWDPDTQRFYFNVWDTNTAQMVWGYSKSTNPTTVSSASWCSYKTAFGYASTSFPDYPKLGQTKDFLLIGVNFYPTSSSTSSTSSDLLWIAKPQGSGTVTTCPAAPTSGKIVGLKNADGTQAFTPEPAIQTDPSSTGYVLGQSDIECTAPKPCNNTGTKITVFTVTNGGGVPAVSAPNSITVPTYMVPTDAAQKGTTNKLDTLDGRLLRTVSAVDPRFGVVTVWTSHAVAGGGGAQANWYEIDPAAGTVKQSGSVAAASYWVFNPGISPDRTCTATTCAHGDSMVLGATVSSSTSFPLDGMLSKIGAGAISAGVLAHASATFDKNFTCSPCRWGDYAGATPDPGASLTAAHGEVWLTQMFTNGGSLFSSGDGVYNWEAKP